MTDHVLIVYDDETTRDHIRDALAAASGLRDTRAGDERWARLADKVLTELRLDTATLLGREYDGASYTFDDLRPEQSEQLDSRTKL